MRRAEALIPGGVNSPVRAFRSVGGDPVFIARGEGALSVRRRRQPLHRLRLLLGTAAAGPSPSRHHSGPRRGARHRHQLRRAHRARGRTGRGHCRRRSFHRNGAPGEFRHRSHHVGHSPGARIHRPRPDRQIRGLLSRPRRFAAGEGRFRRGDAGHCRYAGRAQGFLRYHHGPALQFARCRGSRLPHAWPRHRRRDRRAGGGQHGLRAAAARLPRRTARRSPSATARC